MKTDEIKNIDGYMIILKELQKISEEFEESIKQRVKDVFDKRQMRHNTKRRTLNEYRN